MLSLQALLTDKKGCNAFDVNGQFELHSYVLSEEQRWPFC